MTTTEPTTNVDRGGLQILDFSTCVDLLEDQYVGRVAFMHAGEPLVFPVNYRFHRGTVVFRTAVGQKLDAAGNDVPVAFEIDGWDDTYQSGWSVLVRGWMEEVTSDKELEELEQVPLTPWARSVERPYWVRIVPNEISGRRIA